MITSCGIRGFTGYRVGTGPYRATRYDNRTRDARADKRKRETLSVLPSLDTTHPPAAFPYTTRCTSPASPPSGQQTHSRGS